MSRTTNLAKTMQLEIDHLMRYIVSVALIYIIRYCYYESVFMKADNTVPTTWIKSKRVIYGRVVKVIDGDGFRMVHLPFFQRLFSIDSVGTHNEKTLSIRLAGIDAPECANFGHESQPFSMEAQLWLQRKLHKKIVKVKILRRDRYGRIVGMVTYPENFCIISIAKNASIEIIRSGLAVMYRGSDAEYDGLESKFEALEYQAQIARRGMWRLGKRIELPSHYKRKVN